MPTVVRLFPRFVPLLALTFLLAACVIPLPISTAASTTTDTSATDTSSLEAAADRYAADLTVALQNRDFAALQSMMGASFHMAHWRSEGMERPPALALMQLRNVILGTGSAPLFPADVDQAVLLDGTDPRSLWGPTVEVVRTIYATGLGAEQKDAAIFVIARAADNSFYWHGMLIANRGFAGDAGMASEPDGAVVLAPTAQGATGEAPASGSTPTPAATASALPAVAPEPLRIQFAQGSTGTVVRGVAQPGNSGHYLLWARAEQVMTVELVSSGGVANFAITGADDGQPYKRLVNESRVWTMRLPQTQDYRLTVDATDAVPFELHITIETPPAMPTAVPTMATPDLATEQIRFAPGATAATYSGDLLPGATKRFVLEAAAGQQMNVRTNGYRAPVDFTITSPAGRSWRAEQFGSEIYIFAAELTLPADGEYTVTISTPTESEATNYDITFSIVTPPVVTPPVATPAPPEPAAPTVPERINFAAGADSATATGTLLAGGGFAHYLLGAASGQTMNVTVTTTAVPVDLTIATADGTVVAGARGTGAVNQLVAVLPVNGDYLVSLATPGAAPDVDYSIEFTIR